ncbi:MAG: molecular chaperone DjlA [Bacteroidetes bacterium HGW-Bacteroidetes-6]|jgi:DnaJ like chaperone protein|nr:MAG: molecular chaperone DjlA [Bacteroidetes bacterium HGW-Bacteroidetes-6]
MAKLGKWVGGALGWAFGGPLGALFGFFLGSVFDAGSGFSFGKGVAGPTTSADFRLSMLALLAAVMKADRKNLKVELDFIKNIFRNSFGESYTREILPVLKELLEKDIPVRDICLQIRTHMEHPARLELLNILFALAYADKELHLSEENLLRRMAADLGISEKDFQSIRSMHVPDTGWAYKVLEVEPTATNDEIRKAYRRMAMKYHPDKVAHLGDDVMKSANEKFQAVNRAWNQIKEERKIV